MSSFKCLVTEDVAPNRLLSMAGGNGVPEIKITEAGGTPDFRSDGSLTADTQVNVILKNNPVWVVEAGEDLTAGTYVEVGEGGVLVASESTGIGYVAEAVAEGGLAKLVRKASGEPGPKGDPFTFEDFTPAQLESLKGPKGDPGAPGKNGTDAEPQFTEEQVTALLALLEE